MWQVIIRAINHFFFFLKKKKEEEEGNFKFLHWMYQENESNNESKFHLNHYYQHKERISKMKILSDDMATKKLRR